MRDVWGDIVEFGRWHVESRDIDPVYPVLRDLCDRRDVDAESRLWLLFCYVAFYDLASGLTVWEMTGTPDKLDRVDVADACDRLPKATERRGHRRPGFAYRHLQSVAAHGRAHGSLWSLVTSGFGDDPEHNWLRLQDTLMQIHGNGRWAAYKSGELMMEIADLPVRPTDAGNAWSSGPRKGLALLFDPVEGNGADAIAQLDAQVDATLAAFADAGLPLRVEQVETILCDFASMDAGRFYVGHDIDHLQHQIEHAPALSESLREDLWVARERTIDAQWRGEAAGWTGPRKDLNRLYRETGQIVWWAEAGDRDD